MRISIKRIIFGLVGFVVAFLVPWFVFYVSTEKEIYNKVSDVTEYDAAIILGAHITEDEEPTDVLRERLDAGVLLLEKEKINTITVSNTELAAQVMKDYLVQAGMDSSMISIDPNAVITSDSCQAEMEVYSGERSVILLSQGFHLSRAITLCKKIGIHADGFKVESVSAIDKSKISPFKKVTKKISRFIREAGLDWLVVTNIYK